MEELRPDEATAATDLPAIDLTGVPDALHSVFRAMPVMAESDLEAARMVSSNQDGSVVVRLTREVKVKNEEHGRLRLRPLKARDYFDGTYGDDAEDPMMLGSLRFASRIAHPAGIVDELLCLQDMKAVYFGVIVARKNFSSPRR